MNAGVCSQSIQYSRIHWAPLGRQANYRKSANMSMTGSLVGYDHNGPEAKKLNRSLLNTTGSTSKQCPSLNSSISNSVVTTASSRASKPGQYPPDRRSGCARRSQQVLAKHRLHLNTLWSIWYGVLVTLFQGYLVVQGAHRFLSKCDPRCCW